MVNLVPMVLWDYKPYARGFDQIVMNCPLKSTGKDSSKQS